MTPQQKAKELYRIFYITIPSDEIGLCDNAAKQCALIAVDEILEVNKYSHKDILSYWQEVKKEIEKL